MPLKHISLVANNLGVVQACYGGRELKSSS